MTDFTELESAFDYIALLEPTEEVLSIMWGLGYAEAAGGKISSTFFLEHPEAAQWARTRAGSLIKGVDDWTRERIRHILADALSDPDMTDRSVADAINALFDGFEADRAATIARTELAWASGMGASSSWRSVGVQFVSISDGVDSDTPCAEADGAIWTIEDYEANILEHPNCSRSGTPVMASEVVDLADVSSPDE